MCCVLCGGLGGVGNGVLFVLVVIVFLVDVSVLFVFIGM